MKIIMRKFLMIILAGFALCGGATSASAQICEAEAEYLARAIATSYEDVSFGGKVAIAAVVINVKEAGLAESVPAAVAGFVAAEEFKGIDKTAGEIDGELYRICRDAVNVATEGADPTGGAMYFRRLDGKTKADLRFDDTREDGRTRRMRRELERLASEAGRGGNAMLIDDVGFY